MVLRCHDKILRTSWKFWLVSSRFSFLYLPPKECFYGRFVQTWATGSHCSGPQSSKLSFFGSTLRTSISFWPSSRVLVASMRYALLLSLCSLVLKFDYYHKYVVIVCFPAVIFLLVLIFYLIPRYYSLCCFKNYDKTGIFFRTLLVFNSFSQQTCARK